MTKQELLSQIRDSFPDEIFAMLAGTVIAAIGFEPLSGEVSLGGTRFGGTPDLNPAIEWPLRVADNVDEIASRGGSAHAEYITRHLSDPLPYQFIAQIDLADANGLGDAAADLPDTGRLLFFYDLSSGPWGNGPESARVIWDQGAKDDLVRADLPVALLRLAKIEEAEHQEAIAKYPALKDEPYNSSYWGPPRPMRMVTYWSLPSALTYEVSTNLPLNSALFPDAAPTFTGEPSLYDIYSEFVPEGVPGGDSRVGWSADKLLGLPDPEQDDPRYDAAMIAMSDGKEPTTEQYREFFDKDRHRAGEWRLLLQVSVADYLQTPAEGTIYFLIRTDDLQNAKFDRVIAVYQQT